jgi:uncharacterized protein (TIGR00299 family) protein
MSRRSSTGSKINTDGNLLHLDCFSGIAGNMLVGALLDLGLSRKELESDLAGLGVEHKLRVSRVRRGALAARYVRVEVPKGGRGRRHQHGRHYADIVRILKRARLDRRVRQRALAIFEALGRAEARVHGTPLEKVHFHAVGAVDAIVDVTAAAIGLERLGVARVTCSPLALGHGRVETEHGRLPLPAPATLELLRGLPTEPAHVAWETVTPTGAAIARTLADEFRSMPAMEIAAIGHGAGEDRPGPMPNVLRAVLGRDGGPGWDRVLVLETHLDDFVPEHFDYLMERLFEAGALDVSIQPLQMKKNRPGFLVRVLGLPSQRAALAGVLFAESTALGVRATEWDRLVLGREERRVITPFGRIGVKLVRAGGRIEVSAEYEDCKRAARKAGAPLREVVRAAEAAARAELAAAPRRNPRLTSPRQRT